MLYLRKNPINWLKNNLSFPPAQAVVLSVRKCREHPHGHRGESNTGSEVPWVVEHPFAVCCGVKPLIPLLQGQCHGQQGTAAGRFPKLTVVWRSRKASSVLVMHPRTQIIPAWSVQGFVPPPESPRGGSWGSVPQGCSSYGIRCGCEDTWGRASTR